MQILTITVTMLMDDEMDDSLAILESQVAEALGFIGDVQTCDIYAGEPEKISDADERLSDMFDEDDDE